MCIRTHLEIEASQLFDGNRIDDGGTSVGFWRFEPKVMYMKVKQSATGHTPVYLKIEACLYSCWGGR